MISPEQARRPARQRTWLPPHLRPPAAGESRRIALPSAPASIRTARDFTSAALQEWDLTRLAQDAMLIASELVTNAIFHGGLAGPGAGHPPVGLSWVPQRSRVLCAVTDSNVRPPLLIPASLCAESGRGLQIVDALATAWGWIILGAHRKAVWAALQLTQPPPGEER